MSEKLLRNVTMEDIDNRVGPCGDGRRFAESFFDGKIKKVPLLKIAKALKKACTNETYPWDWVEWMEPLLGEGRVRDGASKAFDKFAKDDMDRAFKAELNYIIKALSKN